MILQFDPNDPGYEVKHKLLSVNHRVQKFRVVATLEEKVMTELIQFARMIVFNDDLAHLYLAKTECVNQHMKKKQENKQKDDSEDSDDVDVSDVFKGHMPSISKENELAVWKLIEKLVDEALAKYPTGLEEDIVMLD